MFIGSKPEGCDEAVKEIKSFSEKSYKFFK
jgi:hypothetical protein